jgi:hypothetical protein
MSLWFVILATAVGGFGKIGHSLTGKVAQAFLSPKSAILIDKLLPEYAGQLEGAAVWADQIKSNRSYDWAKSLHYVNPVDDNPPGTCSYRGSSDCPTGMCIVEAIHNYTTRFNSSTSLDSRSEALKFLIHFIGDIHQPLHITGRGRGGTQAQVR